MPTLKIVLSGEDTFEKDLSKSPTLGRGNQGSKMDMMMLSFTYEPGHKKICIWGFRPG